MREQDLADAREIGRRASFLRLASESKEDDAIDQIARLIDKRREKGDKEGIIIDFNRGKPKIVIDEDEQAA